MKRDPITIFLNELREHVPDATLLFTSGGCYGLYLMIRAFYPTARPWYDPVAGHVYSEVNGTFYDIRGRVRLPVGSVPLSTHKPKMARAWRWRFATAGQRLIRQRQIEEIKLQCLYPRKSI